jgi:Animal haem peroxidase
MARIRHGEVASLNNMESVVKDFKQKSASIGLAAAPLREAGLTRFDYMFPQLQTIEGLLDANDPDILTKLKSLGKTMNDRTEQPALDSIVPAAYTYFGQFIAHDITLELHSDEIQNLDESTWKPLTKEFICSGIKNRRTPTLDLDCVYGITSDGSPVPRIGANLSVGAVSESGFRPPNTNNFNDVPRKPRSDDPRTDREALIGDARNDQNLILAQLHVAFLRAHNTLVNRGMTFNEARTTLTQHYQWLIIHDYLKRLANNEIINDILIHGSRFYRPPVDDVYMPLEFSAAAFRFGHSMVRGSYDYNLNFMGVNKATLLRLFDLTSFSGELQSFDKLPEKWIIEWKRFLDGGTNVARCIDTQLVDPLTQLQDMLGARMAGVMGSVATRNLLRGYLLRIPIGQKVAELLGFPPLTPIQIKAVAANADQASILESTGLAARTPLWFYILAESARRNCLGPVGSTMVAEVLIGLIRWTENSILSRPGWKPTLGSIPGTFTLKDFFRLGGVWN